MEKKLQNPWVVGGLAIFCCALWGSAFPFVKIGYELFHIPADAPGSQILFAGIRFTLAGVLVVMFGSLLKKRLLRPRRAALGRIARLALLQTALQYFFFYIGLAHTSGVKGSIIVGTNSLIAILVAALIFRQEKLTVGKLAGCLVGLAGVTLANLGGDSIGLDMTLTGEGFVLLSVVSYAFSSVLMKVYSKDDDPVMLSGYQFMAGGVLLMLLGLVPGGKISVDSSGAESLLSAVGVLVYLAFLSAAAYTIWGILLKYNSVSKVTIYGFSNPVIGVFLSALLLGEGSQAFTLKNLGALVLVCLGILIVNRFAAAPKAAIGEDKKNEIYL